MKKVFRFILLLLLIYVLFVMIDSIRIGMHEREVVKPIITLSSDETSNVLTYSGLGYKVSYNVEKKWISDTEIDYSIYSAEFKWLDLIPLWKWSEEVQ